MIAQVGQRWETGNRIVQGRPREKGMWHGKGLVNVGGKGVL